MSNTNIGTVSATGEEIGTIINKMEEALIGEKKHHVCIALLAMFIQLQYPEISQDNAFKAVEEISEYTCVYIDNLHQEQNGNKTIVN